MGVPQKKLAVSQLSPDQAELLLRKVLKSTALYQVSDQTRPAPSKQLFEDLLRHYAPPSGSTEQASDEDLGIAKQALMVLAADDAFEDYVINPERYAGEEKPTSFSIDPVSILSLTTLAMVVLSTYLNIKKDKDGWSFELKITPLSDKLKKELFSLIKKITSGLS
ncbi:hypothetical protein SNE25_16070 [Mucilaginibacter sabulilitoris]|uniref:Uncharacterized protein n=1 Tax=Mucilaginibacter sabulilitoris TaxID=1173583 RepID=A0ABZ0TZ00_9SPHI|nr:hypothetical protein [Mucilaginibacter sabulilitoris]WPU97039.1 hypothetical protein SNE25_16070 [Mucilaginibacter sabulilitoris]